MIAHTPTDDLCNFILTPLDLSAKADSQNQSGSSDKSANNSMQADLDLFNSLLFDTDVYNNTPLSLASDNSNSVDANKVQGPKSSSAAQCDTTSSSNSEAKANIIDIGDQNTNQTPDLSGTDNQLRDYISKAFNIDSLLANSSQPSSDNQSTGSDTVTSTTLQTPDAMPSSSDSIFNTQDSKLNSPVSKVTSSESMQLSPDKAKSNDSCSISVISSGNTDSSQSLLKSSDPMWSSKDDVVNKIKQSLPCYQMDTDQDSSSQKLAAAINQSSSDFIKQTATMFCQSMSSLKKKLSSFQTGDKDITQNNGNIQQTSVSQSRNSIFPQTGLQTFTQTNPQNQTPSGSQSTYVTGSPSDQGLPGGSKLYTSQTLGLSNQSAFRVINSVNDAGNQTAANSNSQFKRSKSYTDQSYMYNPLTLPKSQKESYMRSFSSSSLNSWSPTDYNKRKSDNLLTIASALSTNSMDSSVSASEGPYQLPPKKQKRCFVELKCTSCQVDISGDKCCKCPNGHATCARCLEERVKKILTGKAKVGILP